jgi:hypothetical protein
MAPSGIAWSAYGASRHESTQWSVAIMSTLAFIWMYWTGARRAEVIGPRAPEFSFKG